MRVIIAGGRDFTNVNVMAECKTTHLESIQTSVEFLSKLRLTDTGLGRPNGRIYLNQDIIKTEFYYSA